MTAPESSSSSVEHVVTVSKTRIPALTRAYLPVYFSFIVITTTLIMDAKSQRG